MEQTKRPRRKRTNQKERILEVRYDPRARCYLRFADGFEGTWTFQELGLDMSGVKPRTIRLTNETLGIESKWGDNVCLDPSSLRANVDKEYQLALEKKLQSLAKRIGL